MVIALREDRNLRLSNLPMCAAVSTLETDLAFMRKAGLVFTARDYYPATGGKPPRMRSQIWDMRSLNANLAHVQKIWFSRQAQTLATWHALGERSRSPVYEFPTSFKHRVTVPHAVLEDIAAGRFYPVPEKWLKLVSQTFSLDEIATFKSRRSARTAPTARNTGNRERPTASKTGGHLVDTHPPPKNSEELLSDGDVFAHFSFRKAQPYHPSGNDRKALKALRGAGYSLEEIIAAINDAFDRGDNPNRFAYCVRIVNDRPPARLPATPVEPQHASTSIEAPTPLPELEEFVAIVGNGDPPNASCGI